MRIRQCSLSKDTYVVDQNVLWLHVSVKNLGFVTVGHSSENLEENHLLSLCVFNLAPIFVHKLLEVLIPVVKNEV